MAVDPRKPEPSPTPPDPYARESFTFRRMKRWQITGIIIALILFVIAAILWL